MLNNEVHDALHRLPGMSKAHLVEQLADGPTNASYLVARDDERFVLRLDKAESLRLGLDRENERAACAALAAAGLAPAYSHFDVAAGICLRPFIAGRCLQRKDLLDRRTLQHLADLLRRLHQLPPVGKRFDASGAIRRYSDQLATPQAAALAERAAGLLAEIGRQTVMPALCHNDLVAENMLDAEEGGLLLIDWEYAAIGDPYFDLAVVVRHHELGDDLARHLLSTYLEGTVTDAACLRLALQCDFYDCLLALWNLRVSPAGPA